jgi:hypothetical protein
MRGGFANRALECVSFLAEMRHCCALRFAFLIPAICLCLQGQDPKGSGAQLELKGLPPRAAPGDYQSQAKAGAVTIGAEFKGHSIADLEGTLTTEDYVVVEAGLFGPPGAKLQLSPGDFSLRINGRRTPLPGQPFGFVLASVKDPLWEPPSPAGSKSKTKMSGGGNDQGDSNAPPAPVKVPIELRRAWAQRVQRAALPEGDRALPQAGLIFFEYRGKADGIRSVELTYDGPAGKATLALPPY